MQWENKYLNAEEIAVIVPIPEAVLDDADYDIFGEAKPRITEAIGKKIDEAVLFGTDKPASWPDAIVPAAISAGNFINRAALSPTNDLALEVSNAMGLVEADGFMPNGHAARIGLRAQLRNLRDENRQLLYLEGLTGAQPQTLYGDPLFYVKNGAWPDTGAGIADLVTGDWNMALLGIRQDITYKILTEAVIQDESGEIVYNLAQQDMVALRVVIRIAYQTPNPITALNPNPASRYPFSVLRVAP
jgi:HK97 family phage major capsid protein